MHRRCLLREQVCNSLVVVHFMVCTRCRCQEEILTLLLLAMVLLCPLIELFLLHGSRDVNFPVLFNDSNDLIIWLRPAKQIDYILMHYLNHLGESFIVCVQLLYHLFCIFMIVVIGDYRSDSVEHFAHVEVLL